MLFICYLYGIYGVYIWVHQVLGVHIIWDALGRVKGEAYAEFGDEHLARQAMALHKHNLGLSLSLSLIYIYIYTLSFSF